MNTRLSARPLVSGRAQGDLLHADVALSFWGGVDPVSGEIIDRHHPLSGEVITGRVLAIPRGRGSCTGSSVLMELILNGHGPSALILAEPDEILALGALVAEIMFGHSLPVVSVGAEAFAGLRATRYARVEAGTVDTYANSPIDTWEAAERKTVITPPNWKLPFDLRGNDLAMLEGAHGIAAQVAMRIVLCMAELQGAKDLVDITQAHIDGCVYTGPASLRFARQLCDWGAKVRVATTLNSISVDYRRWRELGVDTAFGEPASQLADAYLEMGARPSFTCAPYLLDGAPEAGEQIVWAESNAVVYANSVLGARTQKYPDYLDICIALTGRAPLSGCHLAEQRRATLRVDVPLLQNLDDAFYPLLGYHIGGLAGSEVPLVCGLEHANPNCDDLKAFGAAFATTCAAPMFHIAGVTPEASSAEQALGDQVPTRSVTIEPSALLATWQELDHAEQPAVDLVSLGNPHFSLSEFASLASLCRGRTRCPEVAVVITCGRDIYQLARDAGYLATVQTFGAEIVTDTCWCMLGEPVVPKAARTLMTNSGKYAHYAPGLVGREVHFGSLAECVEAACNGRVSGRLPAWLDDSNP